MARPTAKIDLTDPSLFGNDAAEDEEDLVFASYALERSEVGRFSDATQKLRVVQAYKGEGKSALLRIVRAKIPSDQLVVGTSGPSLSPDLDGADSDAWVRGWKEKIYRMLACEIGSTIGAAWTDDAMSLVEEAEANGFKSQSFVWSIYSRLKLKSASVEVVKQGTNNPERVISRYSEGKQPIWLIVDDVDQNFSGDARSKIRVASFFIACREILNLLPELRVRTAVRPNVWTTIKREFEALSHVQQYIDDLPWKQSDIRRLLAQRIEAYLVRNSKQQVLSDLSEDAWPRDETLISFAFDHEMPWGGKRKPPHVILATLSRYRPRWTVELCKEAAASAVNRGSALISFADIEGQLATFGHRRIEDTVAEFRSQCPQIEDLIAAFARQSETYTTDQLIGTIKNRVLNAVHPRISGVTGVAKARDVAAFLFEIGFLSARRDFEDGSYDHLAYADEPLLLRTRTNVDQGVSWEIHPVFRQPLGLDDGIRSRSRRRN